MITVMTEYTRRPKRIWQADGIVDMAIGCSILFIALILGNGIYMIAVASGPHSTYMRVSRMDMFVTSALQLLNVLPFILIEPLKRRFVYPRTGYVSLRINPKARKTNLFVSIVIALVGAAYAFREVRIIGDASPDSTGLLHAWTPEMTLISIGFGLAIALVVNFLKFGFIRHIIVAVIAITATIMLSSVHLDWEREELLLSAILGVSMLIAGASAFARLMRTPRLLEQEDR